MEHVIKLAICDDDQKCLNFLEIAIKEYSILNKKYINVMKFENGLNLLQCNINFDCYIIDVVLEDINGIQLTKQILKKYYEAKFIFISRYINFSVDAFHVNAFRFIVKPIDKKKLFYNLDDFFNLHYDKCISFYDNFDRERNIRISDILYIETLFRNTKLHLNNSNIISKLKISEWLEILDKDFFLNCYKGLVVNLKSIDFIDGNKIILKNNETLFSSKANEKIIADKFYKYLDKITW